MYFLLNMIIAGLPEIINHLREVIEIYVKPLLELEEATGSI